MNHKSIYDRLIAKAKSANREKSSKEYFEQHHVIPRCIGGSDDECNLVLLTAREHFLAHWLLVKIHKDNFKLVYAWHSLCRGLPGRRAHSRLYQYARQAHVLALKSDVVWKASLSQAFKDRIWMKKGDEVLRVHKDLVGKFEKAGYSKGRIIKTRKPHSEETKRKLSVAKLGKPSPLKGKSSSSKGKSYEERYGVEKAKILRNARRICLLKTHLANRGKPSPLLGRPSQLKGRSYEELHGAEKAKILREKCRICMTKTHNERRQLHIKKRLL